MSERDEIRMMASIPRIQSAISIGGDGSTRLKLDIPASEIAQGRGVRGHHQAAGAGMKKTG